MAKKQRHIRIITKCAEWLQDGPLTTTQLYERYNDYYSWGCTMNEIANILAKNPKFAKNGMVKKQGFLSAYEIETWRLKECHSSNEGESP